MVSMTKLPRSALSRPSPEAVDSRSRLATLPQVDAAVPAARDLARQTLAAWGLTHLLGRVELVVSELVTNAVHHARSDTPEVLLLLLSSQTALRVEVHDGDPRPPQRLKPQIDAVGGWGLVLVDEASTDWGTRQCAGGKCVWATFAS